MTQMALVIDLNVCVGCQACVTSCKEWNTSGQAGSLSDVRPYDADPSGTFFNRVQTYEAGEFPDSDPSVRGSPTVLEVCERILRPLGVPVVFGAPVGHTQRPMLTLPLGVQARLISSGDGRLEILEPAVVQ